MAVLSAAASRWRRAHASAAIGLLLAATGSAARAQVDEARLKAAFVYNIVAFASWNAAPPTARLHLCTATDGPLDAELARLDGRQLGQRRIDVRRGFGAGCDVVVHGARDLGPAASPSTLVICDGCALPDGRSAVSLSRENDRIRFEVDADAAAHAGVGFSSQLLRLARRVL